MREFRTAAKDAEKPKHDTLTFTLDDEELVSVRPSATLLVWLTAAQGSETRSTDSRMADLIDGCLSVFDEDSRRYLKTRLLNPEDPFEFDADDPDVVDLMELVMGVIEEWSNHPTKSSSDSTSPSEDSGTGSTENASAKELTSSPSR